MISDLLVFGRKCGLFPLQLLLIVVAELYLQYYVSVHVIYTL